MPEHVEVATSTLVDEISARAKDFSAEDRARLAEELLESLQGEVDADAEAGLRQSRRSDYAARQQELENARKLYASGAITQRDLP